MSKTRIMMAIGTATDRFPIPLFIVDCDVDACDGLGSFTLSNDPLAAMGFADVSAALEYRNRRSRVKPVRPDGQPNRPLSALTIQVIELEKPDAN